MIGTQYTHITLKKNIEKKEKKTKRIKNHHYNPRMNLLKPVHRLWKRTLATKLLILTWKTEHLEKLCLKPPNKCLLFN